MKDLSPYTPRHATEPTHDKTYDVAEALGIHAMQAYGHISAFRARYTMEAPSGRLRGGFPQVERLALWDGEAGRLAQAFLDCGVVDRGEDGVLIAHEHELYAGATMKVRAQAAIRQQRARAKSSVTVTREAERDGHAASLLLTSLSGSGSDGGGGSKGEGAEQPRPPRATGPPRERIGWGGVGFMENPADFPSSPEALAEREAEQLERVLPAWTGKSGAPTRLARVRAKWPAYLRMRDGHARRHGVGHAAAFAAMLEWLRDEHLRWRTAAERAGTLVDIEAICGPPATGPPGGG